MAINSIEMHEIECKERKRESMKALRIIEVD